MGSNAFPLFQPAQQPRQGDNQYGNYGTGMPGIVPNTNDPGSVFHNYDNTASSGLLRQGGTGISTQLPAFPFMATDFSNYLMKQIGQGATPFNLSSYLPSSGGATAPGQLAAPTNDMLKQLEGFYSGDPATSTWQNIIKAQQKNTDMNAANLREQFAFAGNLKGTPFATSMTDFYNQNTLNQNSLMSQMQMQMAQGKMELGQYLQGLDQQSIDGMLKEFIRTRPEYSPYLNVLYGMATTYPPMTGQLKSGFSRTIGDISATLGVVGQAAQLFAPTPAPKQ